MGGPNQGVGGRQFNQREATGVGGGDGRARALRTTAWSFGNGVVGRLGAHLAGTTSLKTGSGAELGEWRQGARGWKAGVEGSADSATNERNLATAGRSSTIPGSGIVSSTNISS